MTSLSSRRSPDTPDTPKMPLSRLSIRSIWAGVRFSFSMMAVMMAGSTEPERVPMMMPSSGVYPIEVSMLMPWSMAQMEAPAPRWQVTILRSRTLLPRNFAARLDTYLCEMPWKPKRRMPCSE